VCERVAASTHDDTTAHSDVAETISPATVDQPDVDQLTQASSSPASTTFSGDKCEDDEDEDGSYYRLEINIQ